MCQQVKFLLQQFLPHVKLYHVLQQASNVLYNEQNNRIYIYIIINAFLIGTREWASYIFYDAVLCVQ